MESDYDHEMVLKSKDWVERLNPDSKLPNINTGRILVPERPVTISNPELVTSLVPTEVKTNDQESKINELTKLVQMLMDENNSTQKTQEQKTNPDSSKLVRPKPLQKPKLKCELCNYTNHSTDDWYRILYCMKCKREDYRTLDHKMYIASLRSSPNYKEQPYQYASPSKQILKSKAKPYPPCTNCGFNDHLPDDCRNYPKYKICGSYDHFTSEDIRIIQIRVCTQPLTIMILSTLKERYIREPILYLDTGCSSSMTGFKSYLHKYVEQPGPKVVFGDNSSCITEGYGSINCGGIVFSKVEFLGMVIWKFLFAQQHDMYELEGDYLLTGAREYNLYTISILDMATSSPVCLMSKATLTKSWLWHRRLSHLNFGFIDDSSNNSMNTLSKEDLDDLFEAMYDEYFKKKSSDMPIHSAA
ncbi:retrovirus-related pol polyprotein from transposon TNT 1-94 [Tanacetum coccineum]